MRTPDGENGSFNYLYASPDWNVFRVFIPYINVVIVTFFFFFNVCTTEVRDN